ncbi:MAG: SH3 domain-containing protein [Alphaproteobacteria bacterium]
MIAKKYLKLSAVLITGLFSFDVSMAETKSVGASTKLEIPRYVSTKSKPVNVRTGPGRRYPIRTVFKQKVPVKIIDEYLDWRKVEDWEGGNGWIHKALLTGKRLGTIQVATTNIYKSDKPSGVIAKVGEFVVVKIDSCDTKWCYVNLPDHDINGYIDQRHIWGVKENERIN